MRKAKEYVEDIQNHIQAEGIESLSVVLSEVISEMIKEIRHLILSRDINTRQALKSIILQQNTKWKSICNRIGRNDLRELFLGYLKAELPELLENANMSTSPVTKV